MAKKDNKNGTPVEFHIPPASLGGKGPRVPDPINQPNWKYKTNLNSNSQLVIATILLVIVIAFSILLIASRLYASPLWFIVIVLGIVAILLFSSANSLKSPNTKNDESDIPPKRKDKKLPRRRKDYK